ncbi:MAG: glycerol dehydrogenase, partial [Thermofilum sp.]
KIIIILKLLYNDYLIYLILYSLYLGGFMYISEHKYLYVQPDIKVYGGPSRYIQGPGVLKYFGDMVKNYGVSKVLVFADKIVMDVIERHGLFNSLNDAGVEYVKELFGVTPCGPETCDEEISRLTAIAKESGCNGVVGVGGGKAIDTAKDVAYKLSSKLFIVPTIASTDAPCSSVSVIYTCDHKFKEYRFYPRAADAVVVDTKVIAETPPRFLACGIGDALGKYTEVPSVLRVGKPNLLIKPLHGKAPMLAVAVQKLMVETIFNYSEEAIESVEKKVVTPALEAVVEATTLLSQIAFECGGLAAAHSIYNGFTVLEEKIRAYHGELVFFGMLTEMLLDGYTHSEIIEMMKFGHRIGLPINLSEIGLEDVTEEELLHVAQKALAPGETIHNKYYSIQPEVLAKAFRVVDAIGREVAKTVPRRTFKR